MGSTEWSASPWGVFVFVRSRAFCFPGAMKTPARRARARSTYGGNVESASWGGSEGAELQVKSNNCAPREHVRRKEDEPTHDAKPMGNEPDDASLRLRARQARNL